MSTANLNTTGGLKRCRSCVLTRCSAPIRGVSIKLRPIAAAYSVTADCNTVLWLHAASKRNNVGCPVTRAAVYAVLAAAVVLPTTAYATAVGKSSTTWSVSPSGEATYTVPIWTPRGTAGLTPTLALTYGHRQSGSLTGEGWGISGVSSITRCNKTWAQDGQARSVKFDTSDRFCLDGNQLKLVVGSGNYGEDGTEYRTELEQFARIKSFGSPGNGPGYFIVEWQDGTISEYGNTTDSRILAGPTTARAWLVNRHRDRRSNYVDFAYEQDAQLGSYHLASVSYTGNSGQSQLPKYRVAFTYEIQPPSEIESGYLASNVIKDITRLTRIDVKYIGTPSSPLLLRRYNIGYEANLSPSSKSRISTITECAGAAGTDCLPATTFSYQNGVNNFGGRTDLTLSASTPRPIMLDINADGRQDLVYPSTNTSGTGTWLVRFGTNSGFGPVINTSISNAGFVTAVATDYDFDGLADLLVQYSGTTWWFLKGTVSGFDPPADTGVAATPFVPPFFGGARSLDINGDGLEDLVFSTGNDVKYRLRVFGATFGPEQVLVASAGPNIGTFLVGDATYYQHQRHPDFDGDGRDDVPYFTRYYDQINLEWVIDYYAYLPGTGGSIYLGSGSSFNQPNFADINKDGLTDIVYAVTDYTGSLSQLYYQLSTGLSMTPWQAGPSIVGAQGVTFADWDGDGFDDVLVANSGGTWWVARSTGEGLSSTLTTITAPSAAFVAGYAADINGDGLMDLTYLNAVTGILSTNLHLGPKPDLLMTATDGFGSTVTFNYVSTAQGNHTQYQYWYPYQALRSPLIVVSAYSASNGIGGTYDVTFWYWGGKLNLQGRGFSGFYTFNAYDTRNGIGTYDYYDPDFPRTGLLLQRNVTQKDYAHNSVWEFVTKFTAIATYNSYGDGTGDGYQSRYKPYITNRNDTDYEVGGTFNNQVVRTKATSYLIGTYGELRDTTTTTTEAATGNGVSAGQTWTARTWIPTRFVDTLNWCVGMPQIVKQVNSHSGFQGTTVTRQTNIDWDGAQCRPTQVQVQPGDPTWQATTSLDYDVFGNVNSQSVTGIGMSTRTTLSNWGTDGRFLQTQTNAANESRSYDWYAEFGALKSLTNSNGLKTSWDYDNFNRISKETRPDDTYTTTAIGVPCSQCDPLTKYTTSITNYAKNATVISSAIFYADAFGRTRESYRSNFTGSGYSTTTTEYDELGNMAAVGLPWTAVGGSEFTPTYKTTFTYDVLGRQKAAIRPVSATDPTLQTTYNYYEGLTVRTLDPEGKESKAISNANGQTRRVVDSNLYWKQFDFDAFGNAVRVRDSLNNTNQSASFNIRGFRTQSVDTDMGTWNYLFNALGELVQYTDAKGQAVDFQYDSVSRLRQRTEPGPAGAGGTVTNGWTWGSSIVDHNVGQLISASVTGTGVTSYSETHYYDTLGRESRTDITDGGAAVTYRIDRSFDANTGFMDSITYPTSTNNYRHKVVYDYQNGELKRVRDDANTVNYWTANTVDALGHVADQTLGNGLRSVKAIDAVTGLPSEIKTGPGGGAAVQNLGYTWDKVGNLKKRTDTNQGLTEEFFYDNLYRLDITKLNNVQNLDVDYNTLGNITNKSDVGAYIYAGPRMHAVTSVAGVSYIYDSNGNITSRGISTVSWYAHNRPYAIANGAQSSTFEYGPNGNYWKQTATGYANGTETTRYIGGLLEIVQGPTVTSYRHHIKANGQTVAVYSRGSNSANNTIYPLRDHLGSTDAVTNASGGVIVKESFAAFGSRRNGSTWSGSPNSTDMTAIGDATRRGFTDHTMLDNIGLVHMNGRVMDPAVGRFLSPDKYIDGALDTQGWNRYAYVKNRALTATDPHGTCSGCHVQTITVTGHPTPQLPPNDSPFSTIPGSRGTGDSSDSTGWTIGGATAGDSEQETVCKPDKDGVCEIVVCAGCTPRPQLPPVILIPPRIGPLGTPTGNLGSLIPPTIPTMPDEPPPCTPGADNETLPKPTNSSLGYDPNGRSELTNALLNPLSALTANSLRFEAEDATWARFPNETTAHNNPPDAFRHAYWSFTMTQSLGPDLARSFGDAHERSGGNPQGETLMDLYNNRVGISLATNNTVGASALTAINGALASGCLRTRPF